MLAPATPMISGFTAKEMSQLPTRLHGQGHRSPKLHGRQGGLRIPINDGTPPFEIPPILII